MAHSHSRRDNSALRLGISVAVLVVLGILLFMQWPRIRTAFQGSNDEAPENEEPGYTFSPVKQFDPAALGLPSQVTMKEDDRGMLRGLNSPEMVPPADARYLRQTDQVIGLTLGGQPRAYPLRIVEYHELVNDQAGDAAVLVTYCPLTDSSAVYQRQWTGGVREFEVTDVLYNSNLLLYDKNSPSETVWAQLTGQGIYGPEKGSRLSRLPYTRTTWGKWLAQHPDSVVMSTNTGGPPQEYSRYRYRAYFEDPAAIWYPVEPLDKQYGAREQVIVVHADSEVKAYPYSELAKLTEPLGDSLAGRQFTIQYDAEVPVANVVSDDSGVVATHAFWFAWRAFYPQAPYFQASGQTASGG